MNLNKIIFKLYCFLWSFERADFYRALADGLDRKVGIRDFLERQASNARLLKNGTAFRIYRSMSARLAAGQGGTFADLLRGIAPHSDQLLMRAVDDAGVKKAEALLVSADAVEFQLQTQKLIFWEMLQPAAAVVIAGYISYLTAQTIASIAKVAPASIWTGFNGFVRVLAEGVNEYGVTISVGLVVAFALLRFLLPRWTGAGRLKVENWPGFALHRDYNAAVVLSSLAMMLTSGRSVREALDALRSTGRPWLRWHLGRIIYSLEQNPSDYLMAFGHGLMPRSVRARLADLTDSKSSFSDAMVQVGSKEIDTLKKRVEFTAKATGFTMLFTVGAFATVLTVGVMLLTSSMSAEADPTKLMQGSVQR